MLVSFGRGGDREGRVAHAVAQGEHVDAIARDVEVGGNEAKLEPLFARIGATAAATALGEWGHACPAASLSA